MILSFLIPRDKSSARTCLLAWRASRLLSGRGIPLDRWTVGPLARFLPTVLLAGRPTGPVRKWRRQLTQDDKNAKAKTPLRDTTTGYHYSIAQD